MKIHRWTVVATMLSTIALAGMLLSPGLRAEEGASPYGAVVLGPGSTVWLEGKSTMHDYESRTSTLSFSLNWVPQTPPPPDAASVEALIRGGKVHSLQLGVPVEPMRSGKSGLDKNLQKALQATKFPVIRFQLGHYTVSPITGSDTLAVKADGTLSVAGHERAIAMTATLCRDERGVWLTGTQPLLMSEYDVHPPKMMLGAIKTSDRIVVHYRLLLLPSKAGATSVERTH